MLLYQTICEEQGQKEPTRDEVFLAAMGAKFTDVILPAVAAIVTIFNEHGIEAEAEDMRIAPSGEQHYGLNFNYLYERLNVGFYTDLATNTLLIDVVGGYLSDADSKGYYSLEEIEKDTIEDIIEKKGGDD